MRQAQFFRSCFFRGCYGAVLGLLAVTIMGCSSGDFGTVTGKVTTTEGEPLPNALVTFFPQPDGRSSSGRTDESGEYELIYSRQQKGAVVGQHQVRITTANEGGDYGENAAKETIPAKYNVSSELVEEVAPGNNVINFELDLAGRVIQSGY